MSPITTHILDTSLGQPAAGVSVSLFRVVNHETTAVGEGVTDQDGRIGNGLIGQDDYIDGTYRLVFDVHDYFERLNKTSFYPQVTIDFQVVASQPHYHVPLLLSPFGYTTYRGS
ncbi:MAG: hydroxyisourate hydrolase [Planctomycetota bacterium]